MYHTKKIPMRRRRTATSVMAGYFDIRPSRDVLTSVLNGVPSTSKSQGYDEEKAKRKQEKKERRKERERARTAARAANNAVASTSATTLDHGAPKVGTPQPAAPSTSSFWKARPTIHIPTMQRSLSITPSPTSSPTSHSLPRSTPDPSTSSSTSRNSSKRPRTPDDDNDDERTPSPAARPQKKRKVRVAARKGWKGWIEGSPGPSDKLINLDVAPVIPERRTRSGRNFDAYTDSPTKKAA